MATVRQANFTLPADLLEELKRIVPKGEQSRVVGEALRAELKRLRLRASLKLSFGAWKRGATRSWRAAPVTSCGR